MNVLEMEHAQIKVFAMIPLDFVNAIMDLKDSFAKVKLNNLICSINTFIQLIDPKNDFIFNFNFHDKMKIFERFEFGAK